MNEIIKVGSAEFSLSEVGGEIKMTINKNVIGHYVENGNVQTHLMFAMLQKLDELTDMINSVDSEVISMKD